MTQSAVREHYIPLRKNDLVRLLLAEPGLTAHDCAGFRQLCRALASLYGITFHDRLDRLQDAYAPFDPDGGVRQVHTWTDEEKRQRLADLFEDFDALMAHANFKRLDEQHIRDALDERSHWGLNMDVDLGVFERWALYARGETTGKRSRRVLWQPWKLEEQEVPVFQRLVLILKLQPHERLGPAADTAGVYIKAFKDIPKMDLEMLIPGAEVRLTGMDKGLITLPLLTGACMLLWGVFKPVIIGVVVAFLVWLLARDVGAPNPGAVGAGLAGFALYYTAAMVLFGYGYRCYHSYTTTRIKYSLQLTQSLYYQNLDCNAGVLARMVDEAEEQDFREAVLAYWFLWRRAPADGWTAAELDRHVEDYLRDRGTVEVDFEVGDAVAKLERLELIENRDGRYRAVPLERALELLDAAWVGYLRAGVETGESSLTAAKNT